MSQRKEHQFKNLQPGLFGPLEDYLVKLHLFEASDLTSKVVICHIAKNGEWNQETVNFSDLVNRTQQIAHDNDEQDIFITPHTFYGGRKAYNASQLNSFYSDLDYYNIPEHEGKSAEQVAQEAMQKLKSICFPEPTHIVSSGQGLQFYWHFERKRLAKHGNDIRKRWNPIQDALAKSLEEFGVDDNAKDISRVFRVVGTINSKNNTLVKLIWQKGDGFYRYDFEDIATQVFGDTREEYHAKRDERGRLKSERRAQRNDDDVLNLAAKRKARADKRASEGKIVLNGLPISTIMNMRSEELIKLVSVRFVDGIIDVGQRNNFIFHIAVAKSYVTASSSLLPKMIKIAQIIAAISRFVWVGSGSVIRERPQILCGRVRLAGG